MATDGFSPFFSVVIPVYNKRGLLVDALSSVAAQTWHDYELIIVDDASTDGGLDVLHDFPGLPVRLLHRDQPGPGGYAARNLGICESCGTWIAFLDADDLWMPDHLATAARLLEHYPAASVLCTGFAEDYFGEVENVVIARTSYLSAAEVLPLYACRDLFHTNSMVVRRSALLQAGGFPEHGVRRAGDHVLWLRLVLLGEPFILVSAVTSRYRRAHSGVVSNPSSTAGDHPVAVVVRAALGGTLPIPTSWGATERLYLMRLANRKTLLWMMQRRLNGLESAPRIMIPYPRALTIRDSLRFALAVLVPARPLFLLHRLWRRLLTMH